MNKYTFQMAEISEFMPMNLTVALVGGSIGNMLVAIANELARMNDYTEDENERAKLDILNRLDSPEAHGIDPDYEAWLAEKQKGDR